MKEHEDITGGWMYTYITVPRQFITKEHCEFMLRGVGTALIKYIEKNRMVIPKDDLVALIGVKFTSEKEFERKVFMTEEDPNATTTYVKGGS